MKVQSQMLVMTGETFEDRPTFSYIEVPARYGFAFLNHMRKYFCIGMEIIDGDAFWHFTVPITEQNSKAFLHCLREFKRNYGLI